MSQALLGLESGLSSTRGEMAEAWAVVRLWGWAGAPCSFCTDGKLQWEEEAAVNRLQAMRYPCS